MFEGLVANMFATFLHFPCQQAVYTSMVQSDGQHVVIPYPRHDCSLISNDFDFDFDPVCRAAAHLGQWK